MARDLATLKDKLWETFEDAVDKHPHYEDSRGSAENTPFNPKTENKKAIAELAQAILAVENQIMVKEMIEEARKDGAQITLEISSGLVKDVKPMASIKLKQPGAS
ncbi:MAG: hypothetical protein ACAH80_05320 [Alphaproteobacteria bacterium]